jgi:hypothetical protein
MPGQLFTQYFLSEGIRTTSEWEVRWTPIVGQDWGGNRLYQHRCFTSYQVLLPGALLPYESPKIKRGRSLRQSRISLTGLPTSFPDSVTYLIANLYVILRLTRAGLIAILVALSKPIQR